MRAPDALLAAAVASVLLADIEDGGAPAAAVRPLTEAERAAQVRFRDLEASIAAAEESVSARVRALVAALAAELGAALLDGKADAEPAAVVAALQAVTESRPARVSSLMDQTANLIAGALREHQDAAVGLAASEARRQGVTVPQRALAPAGRSPWDPHGRAAVEKAWEKVTGQARDTLASPTRLADPAPVTASEVKEVLADTRTAGAEDIARQGVLAAHGTGRNQVAEVMEPAEIWASEIMDGETCERCAKVDGRQYESLADARRDYPSAGYRDCLGGARCRGTLVFLYDEE